MDFILQNLDLIVFLLLVAIGYCAGSFAEKRHYRSIRRREQELVHLPVVTAAGWGDQREVGEAGLVYGSVVISIDYFKRLLAILRNIFGGRVKSYESLVDRARREAVLRMKEQAQKKGADIVINMRMETSMISGRANRKRKVGSIEVIAYGTALKQRNG